MLTENSANVGNQTNQPAHSLSLECSSGIASACAKGLSQQKLQKAVDYIHLNLTDEISLKSIAAHINMSRFHFCRLFKESMGITPYQYLLQMRIEQAKELLLQRRSSVAEVAVEAGFADQSQLSRHFKRIVGISPKQFAQQYSTEVIR